GVTLQDGSITNGTNTLTAPSAVSVFGGFSSSRDVGKILTCQGAVNDTVITQVVNSTTVKVRDNASGTAVSRICRFGTNNLSFLQAAINAAYGTGITGGIVIIPAGSFFYSGSLRSYETVSLVGIGASISEIACLSATYNTAPLSTPVVAGLY